MFLSLLPAKSPAQAGDLGGVMKTREYDIKVFKVFKDIKEVKVVEVF